MGLLTVLCQNPSVSWGFLGHESPVSLHGSAVNLSLLQTLNFQFGLTVHRAHENALTLAPTHLHSYLQPT